MKPRVRFAPSPTGYLHIGGVRTALFNWLYARHHGGIFILRIENTDRHRSTAESYKTIIDGLTWLGIDWDEGPGKGGPYAPYAQMEKLDRYTQIAEQLIAEGKAYRDYTSEEELVLQRKAFAAAKGLPHGVDVRKVGFQYTSVWREKHEKLNRPSVVRLKMPQLQGSFGFEDMLLGRIEKPYEDFDDFVLTRSDGAPLYNFGCVIDDHDMNISHVCRGQEHINSTFPQLLLYRALGWAHPHFAHLPLILGQDHEKLSKRQHAEADVMVHKRNGILPHALLNFIVRLGWSHGDQETFTRRQLIELFDFSGVGKTNGMWNPDKLLAINQYWLKNSAPKTLAAEVLSYLREAGMDEVRIDEKLVHAVQVFSTRVKTLVDMANAIKPYYQQGVTMDKAAANRHLDAAGREVLQKARVVLEQMVDWNASALDSIVDVLAAQTSAKKRVIAQPIRVAVTGSTASPGMGDTLALLGRVETLRRIDTALRTYS